jgi:hypothetical protein
LKFKLSGLTDKKKPPELFGGFLLKEVFLPPLSEIQNVEIISIRL